MRYLCLLLPKSLNHPAQACFHHILPTVELILTIRFANAGGPSKRSKAGRVGLGFYFPHSFLLEAAGLLRPPTRAHSCLGSPFLLLLSIDSGTINSISLFLEVWELMVS